MGTAVINPVVAGLSAGSFAVGSPGGLPALPLRIAEVQGRMPSLRVNNASHNSMIFRWPHIIARDQTHIVPSFNAWYFNSNGLFESNLGNGYTLGPVSLAAPNGTVVPVYFQGSRTKQVSDGDVDVQGDPIQISDFGYSSLPENAVFWSKGIATVSSAGQYFPSQESVYVGDFSGSQCATYDSAVTTPSDTDVDGVYTAAGTAFTNISHGLRPILLGYQVSRSQPTFLAIGDSNADQIGDDGTNGVGGRGSMQRGMYNRGKKPVPCLNFTRASNRYQAYTTGTKWRTYLPYANILIDQIGQNNVGDSTSLVTMQGYNQELWDDVRTAGYVYIFKTFLLPRVDTTDSMATMANQTPKTGFELNGLCDQLNAWLVSKAGDATIDGMIGWDDIRAETDANKWKTADVSNIGGTADADGIHLSPTGHALCGAWIRDKIWDLITPFSMLDYAWRFYYDTRDEGTILDANGVAASAGGFLGKVAQLSDKSGNARHATQGTDDNRFAVRTFAGTVRGLDGDGTNDSLIAPLDCLIAGQYTFLAVYEPDTVTTTHRVFANTGTGGATTRKFMGNQVCDFGQTTLSRVTPASGGKIIQFARVNGTGTTREILNINSDTELMSSLTSGGIGSGNCRVGAFGDGTSGHFDGCICIVAGINERLFAPEINRISRNLVDQFAAQGATLAWTDVET